jgi:HlyD family secretion protein
MLRKVLRWGAVVVVLLGVGYGVWRWRASQAVAEVQYKAVPAETRNVVARITASGALQATVTVQVGAQVSGRIAKLDADFNTTVKKGAIIATIDPQLFLAAAQREQANYASAKAGVTRAEAQERDAEAVLKRTAALQAQSLASAAELQTAQTSLSVAKAQTDVAKAALQQAQAALNQAQVNLSYTRIHSPIDGVVISRNVDVGQTVAASLQAPVLFTIAEDLRKMQVHTSIAEGDVGRLAPGMGATFTVDAFPGQRFRGKIGQIRNAAQTVQNVVTYNAVIDVDNEDLRLRPGMTATVTIVFAEKKGVLAVPNAALRFHPPSRDAEGAASSSAKPARSARPPRTASAPGEPRKSRETPRAVYVLRGATPERVEVEVGLSDGTVTEITSGELRDGDQVVVDAVTAGKSGGAPGGSPPRVGRMF